MLKNKIALSIFTILFITSLFVFSHQVSAQTFSRTLKQGMKADDVKALQEFLKNQGKSIYPSGVVNGSFGALTKAALIKYQKKIGIKPASGILDVKTRTKINAVLEKKKLLEETIVVKNTTVPVVSTPKIFTPPAVVNFSFGKGIESADQNYIRTGVISADSFLRTWFGYGLGATTTVKVTADDSDSGCCEVNQDANGQVIYFHIDHSDWADAKLAKVMITDLREQLSAHEAVHIYQGSRGCGLQYEAVPLRWLQEGMAEWLSFKMVEAEGIIKPSAIKNYNIWGAKMFPVGPLKDYELTHGNSRYFTFYLAVDKLVAGSSVKALDNFCVNLKKGDSAEIAFKSAFGVTLDQFYTDFSTYISGL